MITDVTPAIVEHWTTDHREWYRNVYLKSEHWAKLKAAKLLNNPVCEKCKSPNALDVHHVRYRHIFDVENCDLMTLCRTCHDKEHVENGMPRRIKVSYESYLPDPIRRALETQSARRLSHVGIIENIELAETAERVAMLLKEIEQFTDAHPSTLRKAKRMAQWRLTQLEKRAAEKRLAVITLSSRKFDDRKGI